MNCPSMGPFPWGAILHEQTAPAWVPHVVTSLPANLLQCGLLSPQVRRSWQEPAPAWAYCRVTASFGHIHLLWDGVPSRGCRWKSSVDFRGTACFTMAFTTGCRGISAPVPGAPAPPPSLILVSVSHILTLLWLQLHSFSSFLKYVITEVLPPSLMSSALASSRSVLEPAGIGSIGHRSFLQKPRL